MQKLPLSSNGLGHQVLILKIGGPNPPGGTFERVNSGGVNVTHLEGRELRPV